MIEKYDCSYDFNNPGIRKKYKYIVIKKGDLDLNGAMMLKGKRDIAAYLRGSQPWIAEIEAICEIKRWVR